MLPCGHSLCVECMGTLVGQHRGHSPQIPCPMCREKCGPEDINYAKLGAEPDSRGEAEECEPIPVNGKYASKITAVVQTLLSIQKTEPTAKALVFSSVSTPPRIVEPLNRGHIEIKSTVPCREVVLTSEVNESFFLKLGVFIVFSIVLL